MDFSAIEGFEEFFSDGVLDPLLGNSEYRENAKKYKELAHRVFLLYEPNCEEGQGITDLAKGGKRRTSTADFDVVFVHGIGSDEFKCWTNEKDILWPATFLPQDFPSVRVLTVGYAHALWSWRGVSKESKKASGEAPLHTDSAGESKLASPSRPESARDEVPKSSSALATNSSSTSAGPIDAVWDSLSQMGAPWKTFWGSPGESDDKKEREAEELSAGAPVRGSPASGGAAAEVAPSSSSVPGLTEQFTQRSTLYNLLLLDTQAQTDMRADETNSKEAEDKGGKEAERQDARQLQSFRLVAADIADRLVSAGVGTGERPVVFIVHSMGGLITKQMIVSLFQLISLVPRRKYLSAASTPTPGPPSNADTCDAVALMKADVFLHSLRGVVFYGTPHFGSGLASVITGLQRYYSSLGGLTPTHVVTGLGDHNRGDLTMLNDRFMEVVARLDEQDSASVAGLGGKNEASSAALAMLAAPSPGISIMSFGETKKLNGLLRVVDPESANPSPENPRFPFFLLDGDHSQINRPTTKTSPGYAMLYGFLDRLQQRGLLLPPLHTGSFLATWETTEGPAAAEEGEGNEGDGEAVPSAGKLTEKERLRAFESEAWTTLMRGHVGTMNSGPLKGRSRPVACTEVLVVLRSLDMAQATLRATLSRFFGRVIPPQFDGIFLLSADVDEFLSRGALLLQQVEEEALARGGKSVAPGTSLDFTKLFLIPSRLLLYWTQKAINMTEGFEQTQRETMSSQAAVEASRSAVPDSLGSPGRRGAIFVSHLSERSMREMKLLEDEVGVLQGEWEGFRRYLSVAIRQEALDHANTGSKDPATSLPGRPPLRSVSDERVVVVFFARAVRSLASRGLHDDGCLFDLVGHFVNSSLELVSAATRVPGGEGVERRPPVPDGPAKQQTGHIAQFVERDAFMALLAESLELYHRYSSADVANASDPLLFDRKRPIPELERGVGEALLPLRTTSSFLLACYHLFVGESPSRTATARMFLESTTMALEDCRRAFARLEQAECQHGKCRAREEVGKVELPFWRHGKDSEPARHQAKRGGRAGHGGTDEKADGADNVWQRTRILTEALDLLSHSLVCLTYLDEIESKIPAKLPRDAEEVANSVRALAEHMRKAQAAYTQVELSLQGKQGDTNKPFIFPQPASSALVRDLGGTSPAASQRGDKGKFDGTGNAKKAFRDALAEILKEIDGVMSSPGTPAEKGSTNEAGPEKVSTGKDTVGKGEQKAPTRSLRGTGEETDGTETWYAAGTNWFTKTATSLPKLAINSLLNAWEAVRRGGEVRKSPEYFASNVFLYWWSVEEYAEWVVRLLAAGGAEGGEAEKARRPIPVTGQDRKRPESYQSTVLSSPVGGSSLHQQGGGEAGGGSAMRRRKGVEARRRQRAHFLTATTKLRCQWATASGHVEVVEARRRLAEALRAEVKRVVGVGEGEATEAAVSTLAKVPQRVTEILKEVRTPLVLGDATQLDASNPFTRCLLGHWHFLNLRSSPDAAHAYAQVMRTRNDPLDGCYQAAAVGLGWVHLHRLGASLSSQGAADHVGRRADWRRLAREQGLQVGGNNPHSRLRPGRMGDSEDILDPLAMRASPAGFVEFCSEVKGLLDFTHSLSQDGAQGPPPPLPMSAAVQASEWQRLRLADMYFHKVLEADPTDVGALCGVARVRSLVPSAGGAGGAGEGALSVLGGAPRGQLDGPAFPGEAVRGDIGWRGGSSGPDATASLNVREVVAYLESAASVSESFLQPTPVPIKSMLAPVLGSYAAYWMGDVARPVPWSQDGLAPGGSLPPLSAPALSLASQQRAAAWTRSQRWYARALELDPCNDWALTSLGLSYLPRDPSCASALQPSPPVTGAPVVVMNDTARGLCLMEMALRVNPTNQWALWGIASHSPDAARRGDCLRLLRRFLTQRYRLGTGF